MERQMGEDEAMRKASTVHRVQYFAIGRETLRKLIEFAIHVFLSLPIV